MSDIAEMAAGDGELPVQDRHVPAARAALVNQEVSGGKVPVDHGAVLLDRFETWPEALPLDPQRLADRWAERVAPSAVKELFFKLVVDGCGERCGARDDVEARSDATGGRHAH